MVRKGPSPSPALAYRQPMWSPEFPNFSRCLTCADVQDWWSLEFPPYLLCPTAQCSADVRVLGGGRGGGWLFTCPCGCRVGPGPSGRRTGISGCPHRLPGCSSGIYDQLNVITKHLQSASGYCKCNNLEELLAHCKLVIYRYNVSIVSASEELTAVIIIRVREGTV